MDGNRKTNGIKISKKKKKKTRHFHQLCRLCPLLQQFLISSSLTRKDQPKRASKKKNNRRPEFL
jgi:hypothetical protein